MLIAESYSGKFRKIHVSDSCLIRLHVPAILLKKLRHMHFPVKSAKFFRTAFYHFLGFTEHLLLVPVL